MIKYSLNQHPNRKYSPFATDTRAYDFHKTLPNYNLTTLHSLDSLAQKLNVNSIMLKDESERFGLNTFKILGASWAVVSALAEHYNISLSNITFSELKELANIKPKLTFVTATDGNHGRGVAHAVKWFNQEAIIYMPKGASKQRVNAIANEGAKVTVLDMNYDDAVRYANNIAAENNFILLQDTAFSNYITIPQQIMDGYKTIISEVNEQTDVKPTHIILQAGVGSLAAAIISGFIDTYKFTPTILIVEPNNAACYYHSNLNKEPYTVTGELNTIMAGLSCGEPSTIAYDIIANTAKAYFSVDDEITRKGMRRLANPLGSDFSIISGESGAVGIGLLEELCTNNEYTELRKELDINEEAIILCISTEGATDLESYESIVKD